MELAAMLARRAVPGAGLLLSLTSRCPLSCAHCSTASTTTGPQPAADDLRRFVGGFTAADRPDVVFLTGGEPLLRPALLAGLAADARAAGAATAVLTGGFFARGGRIPDRLRSTLLALDHVSFSLDVFHEAEVARADVFAVLRALLRRGVPVSLHVVARGPSDPYLGALVGDVRGAFGTDVPVLVSRLAAVGRAAPAGPGPGGRRAAAWREATPVGEEPPPPARRPEAEASPCALAAWPVVAADGVVTACCSPLTVDRRPVPAHLRLGDVREDGWTVVRARLLGSPMLRAVRVLGAAGTRSRFGDAAPGGGECDTCHQLAGRPDLAGRVGAAMSGPGGELLERVVVDRQRRAGAVGLLRRYAIAEYAGLVEPRGGDELTASRPGGRP